MTTRWLKDAEIVKDVNPALALKGWAELNLETCRVLGAFDEEGRLLEVFVLQLFPLLGPLLRVDNEQRDGGGVTRQLVTAMQEYLESSEARGFMAVAESPVTQRLCQRFGMTPFSVPVYGFVPDAVPTEARP